MLQVGQGGRGAEAAGGQAARGGQRGRAGGLPPPGRCLARRQQRKSRGLRTALALRARPQ